MNVEVCFQFLMSGHSQILINPDEISRSWTHSECATFNLAPGLHRIYYNGHSTGGAKITVSVNGVLVATKNYEEGIFNDQPIHINL